MRQIFFLNEQENGPAILEFDGEFTEEEISLTQPPIGSTLIIEGSMITGSKKFEEIIAGIEFKCETSDTNFLLIIKVDSKNADGMSLAKVSASPNAAKTRHTKDTDGKNKIILFNHVNIWKSFCIKRIRYAVFPISDNEIKYL